MKTFLQFITENTATQQATRLGLEGDGHGGWYKDGEFVAKTEKGRLKFYNKRQKVGGKDPEQSEKEKNLSSPNTEAPPVDQEVAAQQQEDTSQQEMTFESGSDSFGGGDMDFSNSFNDALSTGQSIGQFLSNETPDFGKFDVAPPSVQESRTTKAVESLADKLGGEAAQEQLQAQFEANQESGGFEDQTIAVAVIGYNPDIQQYLGKDQLQDQQNWYQVKALYTNAKIDDNKFSFYMMAGKTEKKLKEMIDSQYNKE